MWLDPLVERKHLKNINVTTNQLNVRMEILKENYATDNKQVRTFFLYLSLLVMRKCCLLKLPIEHFHSRDQRPC